MRQDDKEITRQIIRKCLEIQKLSTIRSIYDRIEPGPDGRIRTVLSPPGTDTGRLASGQSFLEPSTNLQNLPSKTAKADPLYEVRNVIIPEPGRMFVEVDYSSAERRLLAYLANERKAIEITEEGDQKNDTSWAYRWFGSKIFDIDDPTTINKSDNYSLYHLSKMGMLAFDRGVSWKTFKKQVNKDADLTGVSISASKSKEIEKLFHSTFPGYRRYFDSVEKEIRRRGFTINCMGRKRIYFGRRSNMNSIVREAVSFGAQAVGDIINNRLRRIYDELDPEELELKLQIHDSIVFETSIDSWRQVSNRVKQIMEEPIDLTRATPPTPHESIQIPAEVAISTKSWGQVREVM